MFGPWNPFQTDKNFKNSEIYEDILRYLPISGNKAESSWNPTANTWELWPVFSEIKLIQTVLNKLWVTSKV